MPPSSSSSSNHYFVSINFFLRTILFFITLTIIILQHVFTFCKIKDRSNGTLAYDYFSRSFGFNSWSATGLYVNCWITVVQYIRTFLLVFLDNFLLQTYVTTFVLEDLFMSCFFLLWTIMNILQLSDCSKRQLASNQPTANVSFIQPFCGSIRCSAYLIPALGSFITFLSSVFLAAVNFRHIRFHQIPRYLRSSKPKKRTDEDYLNDPPSIASMKGKKTFFPLENLNLIEKR